MSTTTAAVLACLVAGTAAAAQAALASALGRRVGVLSATALVGIVGTAFIVVAALVAAKGAGGIAEGMRLPAWRWLVPGALGAIVLTTFTFAPPRIGVFATFALLIAGQLVASALIDATGLFGVDRVPFSAIRVAGLVLLLTGALLVLKR